MWSLWMEGGIPYRLKHTSLYVMETRVSARDVRDKQVNQKITVFNHDDDGSFFVRDN